MKRIAILMPGGVGDVNTPMHVPALVHLITRISEYFDVTVYSVIKPDNNNENFYCGAALVKFIHARYNDSAFKRIFYFIKAFISDHRAHPYNIVHGFWAFPCGLAAVILNKMFHIPSVVSLQGAETASLPEIDYGYLHKPFIRRVILWTIRNASVVTALTEYQMNALTKFDLQRKNIRIIPLSAEQKFFSCKLEKNIHTPLRIVHVAHLNKVKDQMTLIKAFEIILQHIDAELRIVGDDFLDGELQRYVHEHGLETKVRFPGYLQHEKLKAYYHWADILLHTSLYEAQGVAISEALSNGVVVCGTNVGLLSDLSGTAAITVDVRDYKALASKVIDLVKNPDQYVALRSKGYEYAQKHNADWTAGEYKKLYEEVLE